METSLFTVQARGIGSRDYSSVIEHSVEPVIRGYQSEYSNWQTVTVPAGSDLVANVAIPGGFVAIVNDFFASITQLVLIGLNVEAVSDGIVGNVVSKTGYGTIAAHLLKGFPFFQFLRFTIHNFFTVDIDVNIGAVGIYTSEENYYLVAG